MPISDVTRRAHRTAPWKPSTRSRNASSGSRPHQLDPLARPRAALRRTSRLVQARRHPHRPVNFRRARKPQGAAFFRAGWRVRGPVRVPLGRPGPGRSEFGGLARVPMVAASRRNPRRTRAGVSLSGCRGFSHEVSGDESAGQPQLGVGGNGQPGPAVGLLGGADLGVVHPRVFSANR